MTDAANDLKCGSVNRDVSHTNAVRDRLFDLVSLLATLGLMIDLYTWATPNGRKVSIALEELELDYQVIPVNIGADEQLTPDFLRLSPNNKIPVVHDHESDQTLFESGAILLYLADKTGRLGGGSERLLVSQWLMFQMASVGPIFGQTHHFHRFNQGKAPYAEERFLSETHRLYSVLDRRLGEAEYLACDYSIADIATFPWVARWPWHSIDWTLYPHLQRWFVSIAGRAAVQQGYNVPTSDQRIELPNV